MHDFVRIITLETFILSELDVLKKDSHQMFSSLKIDIISRHS